MKKHFTIEQSRAEHELDSALFAAQKLNMKSQGVSRPRFGAWDTPFAVFRDFSWDDGTDRAKEETR